MSSANYHSFFIRLIKHCPPISYLIQNQHPAHLHLAFGFSLIYPHPKAKLVNKPSKIAKKGNPPQSPFEFRPRSKFFSQKLPV